MSKGENYVSHRIFGDLREPGFDNTRKVHDWRNYVGKNTQAIWHTFTDEQRLAIATDADEMASREEWD